MVGPSHTTTPSRIGSPFPEISRSASIRSIYRLLRRRSRPASRRPALGLPHPDGSPPHDKYRDTCPPCPSSSHGSGPEDHLALLEAKRHERAWRPGQRRDQCSGATSVSASSKVAA